LVIGTQKCLSHRGYNSDDDDDDDGDDDCGGGGGGGSGGYSPSGGIPLLILK